MEVMRFGKFVGRSLREVPTDYLKWCYDNIPTCPVYVIEELGSRGIITGGLWLSRRSSSPPRTAPALLSKKQQKRDKRRRRAMARSARQSEEAKQKNEALRSGVVVEGADFDRLRLEFLRSGGDPDACPFDTDDYIYEGPTMATVGGKTVIVPSEFPREVRR